MGNSGRAEFDIGHPAPDRDKVSLGLLMFGLLGAPIAWAIQILVGSGVGGMACLSDWGVAMAYSDLDWANPVMIAFNIGALAIGAAALLVSLRIFRKTRPKHEGSHDNVMEVGEGRSRYLAVWGLWASVLFLLAIAFNTVSIFWSELCVL